MVIKLILTIIIMGMIAVDHPKLRSLIYFINWIIIYFLIIFLPLLLLFLLSHIWYMPFVPSLLLGDHLSLFFFQFSQPAVSQLFMLWMIILMVIIIRMIVITAHSQLKFCNLLLEVRVRSENAAHHHHHEENDHSHDDCRKLMGTVVLLFSPPAGLLWNQWLSRTEHLCSQNWLSLTTIMFIIHIMMMSSILRPSCWRLPSLPLF